MRSKIILEIVITRYVYIYMYICNHMYINNVVPLVIKSVSNPFVTTINQVTVYYICSERHIFVAFKICTQKIVYPIPSCGLYGLSSMLPIRITQLGSPTTSIAYHIPKRFWLVVDLRL